MATPSSSRRQAPRSSRRRPPPLGYITRKHRLVRFVAATLPFIGIENCIILSSAAENDTSRERGGSDGDGDAVCTASSPDDPTCAASSSSSSSSTPTTRRPPLRPSDLPQPVVFTAFESNSTLTLPGGIQQEVAAGVVKQINNFDNPDRDDVLADFAVLPSAVKRPSVEGMLELLRGYDDWDDDPDTVDGMTTHEMFVDSPALHEEKESTSIKYRDADPAFVPERRELRRRLAAIMSPYVDRVLTPAVKARYPEACASGDPARDCSPCYSLVRSYRRGRRQSHGTHHDGHALVTVVVSLSDHGVDYRGGLYVSSGFGQREFLALNKGDAVMHQSSLLHGVQVYDLEDDPARTERWSWILWYRDSPTCEDHGHEWFRKCADEGDALCQQLHATKVGATPGIGDDEVARQVLDLNLRAADGGSGYSAVKVARAYLGQLPSTLPYDAGRAAEYYRKAMRSHHPDGHYGMSRLLLEEVARDHSSRGDEGRRRAWRDPRVVRAVGHLEDAARAGHAYARFNLGVVHAFGYRDGIVDADLAGRWFEASGLPEGYFVAAHQAGAGGDEVRRGEMMDRARNTGYFAPWRRQARQSTGSGGAAGVDLNLPWPPAFDQRRPPRF